MSNKTQTQFVRALPLADLQQDAVRTVQLNGHTLALYYVNGRVYAVDNRCPHMGFPLNRGSVKDGILTCHWHHARFDLETGGAFDQWADDVRIFPVEIRDGEIYVNVAATRDEQAHQQERLEVGLERNISLVIGKAVLVLSDGEGDAVEPFRTGLAFGTRYRQNGWGSGLTMHTCFMNMLPHLEPADRPRALYHGLTAVANDTAGSPPRFPVRPLPGDNDDIPTLKRWFRQFIAVRDDEGAERCIVSAIRAGAGQQQMADMLFSAVTDYRYIDIGHPADFTNKAFEALDIAGWSYAEPVLTSLVAGYAQASRMEESNSWRNPVDLVSILEQAFTGIQGIDLKETAESDSWQGRDELIAILHGDDPQTIADELLAALCDGATVHQLAATVSLAAALRIARFHTSNEFGDWDTALHTFTFANAIQQGLRRAPSAELLRGVFDAAMSIYLDRFLNIPPARLPQANEQPVYTLADFPALLDRQQQVNEAGQLVADHMYAAVNPANGRSEPLLAMLGKLLLREDRNFHTVQCVEAAFKQHELWGDTAAGTQALVAAARYLAAHAPTARAQGQTFQIAARLHRGEKVFEAG
jgi:nitrite reductase/ring-hydroxylating ferredoxin subunit